MNLRAVLEAAGLGLREVVKTMVFLKRMDDFAEVNAAYASLFTEEPPARSAVAVASLPKGGKVRSRPSPRAAGHRPSGERWERMALRHSGEHRK